MVSISRPAARKDIGDREGDSSAVSTEGRAEHGTERAVRGGGKAFAFAGLAGGLLAIVTTWIVQFATPMEVYQAGGPELLETIREGNNEAIWRISSGVGFISVAALIAFAVGLRRHLSERLGAESAVPMVVMASVLVTAGIFAVAMSFRAQVFDGMNGYAADPTAHITVNRLAQDTVLAAWATILAGSASLAVAGFRSRAIPRWLTGFSAVVTALIVVLVLAGVPFPANVPASLWLVAVASWALASRSGAPAAE